MKLSLILNGIYKELKSNCFNGGEIIILGAQIRAGEMIEWLEKSGLIPEDKVIMHSCYEARKEKYKDKVWTVKSEPWDLCGSEVVLLEGFNGGFATEYQKKVEG